MTLTHGGVGRGEEVGGVLETFGSCGALGRVEVEEGGEKGGGWRWVGGWMSGMKGASLFLFFFFLSFFYPQPPTYPPCSGTSTPLFSLAPATREAMCLGVRGAYPPAR